MSLDLASVVRPGDGIVVGQACGEPQTLMEGLMAEQAALAGRRAFLGSNYSGIARAGPLQLSSYCGIGQNRALIDAGAMDVLPVPYSQIAPLIRSGRIRADVVFLQVSPPNAAGEYSLGLTADYLIPAMDVCRAMVAEVNDQVPWTFSERLLRKDDFDLVVSSSRPAARPAAKAPGELEMRIAENALAFIPDGAVLEFGIGALPDAVCALLGRHAGLRVHSGTVGDGVIELIERKVVSRVDCAMLIGSPSLFAFAKENPSVQLRSCEYTHNPAVLHGIERFVAINSAVEVDLTGAVNGEVAKASYVGAVGGALDFIRAANHSPGGASLMLLPAARIVETLSGPTSTPRSEAGIIVTERGAADLRGCSVREREQRLRKIGAF